MTKPEEETDELRCRCGKIAALDVTIMAGLPFATDSPPRSPRHAVHFSTVACRDCAFKAAKLMLEFLESKSGKEN